MRSDIFFLPTPFCECSQPCFFSFFVSNPKNYPAFNSGKILDTSCICMEICRIFMVTGMSFQSQISVTPCLFKDRAFQTSGWYWNANKTQTWNTPHRKKRVINVDMFFRSFTFITYNWDYSKWPSNTFHSLPTNLAELELKAPRVSRKGTNNG